MQRLPPTSSGDRVIDSDYLGAKSNSLCSRHFKLVVRMLYEIDLRTDSPFLLPFAMTINIERQGAAWLTGVTT